MDGNAGKCNAKIACSLQSGIIIKTIFDTKVFQVLFFSFYSLSAVVSCTLQFDSVIKMKATKVVNFLFIWT